MSIILFFLVLFVLVLVHEWGHFIVAKKTGMRVDEFGIGFPPKIFGKKKGETEYTFNALPIGGFVKIHGENYEDAANTTDSDRAFSSRPKWAQIAVLVAGVAMNIIFAWFLFSVTNLIGTPTAVTEADATAVAKLYILDVLPDSPAAMIPAGSIVTTVTLGDTTIERPTPSTFTDLVSNSDGASITITYTGEQQSQTTTITPTKGLISDDPERYAVGTSLALVETKKLGIIAAITHGFTATWQGLIAITVGLWSLISDAVVGNADFASVAGPVGIIGMVGNAASFGITTLLTFTAIISLNLAVINLLPFPALDGGRVVFVLIEAVTRKRIPPEWAGRINLIGFAILMLLMIAVTYNDILKLL